MASWIKVQVGSEEFWMTAVQAKSFAKLEDNDRRRAMARRIGRTRLPHDAQGSIAQQGVVTTDLGSAAAAAPDRQVAAPALEEEEASDVAADPSL